MRCGVVAIVAAGAILSAAPALAENTSALQSAKLDADFTLCSAGSDKCSVEDWHIAVNAKGWTMRATTRFDLQVEDWTESCADGQYRSDAGGFAWTGTCTLSGEPGALCFDVAMAAAEADTATSSRQCFQLLAPHICVMRFESNSAPIGAAPDSPERVTVKLGTVNTCVVSEAQ